MIESGLIVWYAQSDKTKTSMNLLLITILAPLCTGKFEFQNFSVWWGEFSKFPENFKESLGKHFTIQRNGVILGHDYIKKLYHITHDAEILEGYKKAVASEFPFSFEISYNNRLV